jgi:hypothetical protein
VTDLYVETLTVTNDGKPAVTFGADKVAIRGTPDLQVPDRAGWRR